MKRFIQILSASVVTASMMAGVAGATASNTCTISNTGQGSNNTCKVTDNTIIEATCDNNIYVDSGNRQIAVSGTANSSQNNSGGIATSGSAVNENSQTVQIGASCGAAATVATVNTPATPAAGKGAAATPAPAPAAAAKVASLPHTGSNSVLDATAIGVGTIGAAMAVSRLGVSAYRRFALK